MVMGGLHRCELIAQYWARLFPVKASAKTRLKLNLELYPGVKGNHYRLVSLTYNEAH